MSSSSLYISFGESLSLFNFTSSSTTTPLILETTTKVESPINFLTNLNGSRTLTLTRSGKVTVYDSLGKEVYKLIRTDEDRRLPVTSAQLVLDKQIIITVDSNLYSYTYNIKDGTSICKLLCKHPSTSSTTTSSTSPTKAITRLAVNTDSTLIASTRSTSILVHNLTTSATHSLHSKPRATYSSTQFHPTRRTFLAAATSSSLLHLFDTSKPSAPLRTFNLAPTSSLPSSILYLAFSTSLLVSATSIGSISLIDFDKMKVLTSVDLGVQIKRGGISLSSDGRNIVFLVGGSKIGIMDLKTRNAIKEISVGTDGARIEGVCFQPLIKTLPSKSPSKPSAVLAESLNKARLEKALTKGKLESLRQEPLAEVFSPVQFGAGVAKRSEVIDIEPTSRTAFAESIRREAQTSTLKPLTLGVSLVTALSSNSHPHSPPAVSKKSPDLLSKKGDSTSRRQPSSSITSQSTSHSSSIRISQQRQSVRIVSPPLASSSLETPRFPSTSSNSSNHTQRPTASRSNSSSQYRNQHQQEQTRSDSPNLPSFTLQASGNLNNNFTPGPSTKLNLLREADEESEEEEGFGYVSRGKEKNEEVGSRFQRGGKKVEFGSRHNSSDHFHKTLLTEEEEEEGDSDRFDERRERSLIVNQNQNQNFTTSGQSKVDELGEVGGNILKEVIRELMSEFHSKSAQEVQNLHVELLKQSHIQKLQMRTLLSSYLGKELQELREENKLLKIENERLRRGY